MSAGRNIKAVPLFEVLPSDQVYNGIRFYRRRNVCVCEWVKKIKANTIVANQVFVLSEFGQIEALQVTMCCPMDYILNGKSITSDSGKCHSMASKSETPKCGCFEVLYKLKRPKAEYIKTFKTNKKTVILLFAGITFVSQLFNQTKTHFTSSCQTFLPVTS